MVTTVTGKELLLYQYVQGERSSYMCQVTASDHSLTQTNGDVLGFDGQVINFGCEIFFISSFINVIIN